MKFPEYFQASAVLPDSGVLQASGYPTDIKLACAKRTRQNLAE
jgi:hypothetical protein